MVLYLHDLRKFIYELFIYYLFKVKKNIILLFVNFIKKKKEKLIVLKILINNLLIIFCKKKYK